MMEMAATPTTPERLSTHPKAHIVKMSARCTSAPISFNRNGTGAAAELLILKVGSRTSVRSG